MMSNYPILRRLVSLLTLIIFSLTLFAFARAFGAPDATVEPGDFASQIATVPFALPEARLQPADRDSDTAI